jgi:quercetin dioxygenase-like cupin family protein
VNHVFHCTGVQLFRLGRWRAELWLVPLGVDISDHKHRYLNAWLMLIGGTMTWRRWNKSRRLRAPAPPFYVPAGVVHGAQAHQRSAFITLEHWVRGAQVSSAAHDLQLA